jgi:hypothetical protein
MSSQTEQAKLYKPLGSTVKARLALGNKAYLPTNNYLEIN